MKRQAIKLFAHPDFWARITWSGPKARPPAVCSVCSGALPDVPMMLWKENGACAAFCDTCAKEFIR